LSGFQDRNVQPLADSGSLGLARSSIGLGWYFPRGAGVEVVLRPDGLNNGLAATELDTRSGSTVEEASSIHFFDEFRIIVKRPSLESHVGVVGQTLENYAVSPDVLGFGLRVQGPKKSFAAGFSSPDLFQVGTYGESSKVAIGVGIDILSGRDDRHDSKTGSHRDSGERPAKREPYWGGSASLNVKFGDRLKLGFTLASLQERAETGIRQLEWLQLALRQRIEVSSFPKLLVGLEGRHLKQNYDKTETKVADVKLTSVGLTSAVDMPADEKLFVAIWYGSGLIHPEGILSSSVSATGLQSELGWSWMVEDHLELVAVASREWRRDGNVGGGSHGGFGEGAYGRSSQSRFALRISYSMGDQI
jgi:hypothetical protein